MLSESIFYAKYFVIFAVGSSIAAIDCNSITESFTLSCSEICYLNLNIFDSL